jgi:hypothetical protein
MVYVGYLAGLWTALTLIAYKWSDGKFPPEDGDIIQSPKGYVLSKRHVVG